MESELTFWQRMTKARGTVAMSQTLTYYAAFTALGLTTAVFGPSLLGLAGQTGSTLAQISFIFTARSLGYMIGSLAGGRVLDRLPPHRTLAIAITIIVLGLSAIPLVPLLWVLVFIVFVIGLSEAVVDVGGNTLIVFVHREGVAPYMNGLHLFFAVGAVISPLVIAAVLELTGNFQWAYWLLALVLLPLVFRFFPLPNPEPIVSQAEEAKARPNYLLVFLVALYLLLIAGGEISYSGWVSTYVITMGLADAATAALVAAAFWAAFMVGRIISIPLAVRLRPRVIILSDLLLALIGIGVLISSPTSTVALWGGTFLFGLGMASAFPTILTFAGRHMTITGTVTGLFFGGASLGSIFTPTIIGQLFERVGPVSLLWVIAAMIAGGLGVFGLILLQVRAMGAGKG